MIETRFLSLIVVAAVLVTASAASYARGGGGGGGMGGASAGHMSSAGVRDSNGPHAADRDKGRARAADRTALHAVGERHHGKTKRHLKTH